MPYEYVTTPPARCRVHEIFRFGPLFYIIDWLNWLHWIKQHEANNVKDESAPYCTEFELLTNIFEVKSLTP